MTEPKRKRGLLIEAHPDLARQHNGVAVAASYRTSPPSASPWIVRGISPTARTERVVVIEFTEVEARRVVRDWLSFGLFGPNARIETSPNAR